MIVSEEQEITIKLGDLITFVIAEQIREGDFFDMLMAHGRTKNPNSCSSTFSKEEIDRLWRAEIASRYVNKFGLK